MSKENTIINSSKDVNYCLNRNVFDAINNSIEESKNINDNNISGKNKGKNLYNKNNKRKNNNYIRKEYKELNINEKQFEIRRGDWFCQYCYNLNFAFRTKCNRCNNSKIVFIFGIKKSPLFRKLCFR